LKPKTESATVIEEHGVFKRTFWRKGKQQHQKTERKKKNPEKVVLGEIGDLQIYVYPYDFPDKIFIGCYPKFSMVIGKEDLSKFFALYNKMRWYLEGEWYAKRKEGYYKPKRLKATERTRLHIQRSYNCGLERVKKLKK